MSASASVPVSICARTDGRRFLADPNITRVASVAAAVEADGIRSIAGVPIRTGETAVGALFIANRRTHRFTASEMALLSSLADQAAIALANAHLHHPAGLIDPAGLDVRLECRSYELGWILWSFGRRTDLEQLTHDPAFAAPAAEELRRAP